MWNLYDREWENLESRSNDVQRYVIWYIWVTKIQCLTMPRALEVVVSGWGSARLVAILACAWKGLENWNIMTSSKSLFDFLTRKMHFSVFGMKKLRTFGGRLTIWDCRLHGFAPGSGTIGWHDLRISSKRNESYELHELLGQHTN